MSQGPCQFRFDAETAIVTPASGTPIAFDLGDVERAVRGEWDFALTLFTGRRLELRQFGAAFSTMSEELLAAWRDRKFAPLSIEDTISRIVSSSSTTRILSFGMALLCVYRLS